MPATARLESESGPTKRSSNEIARQRSDAAAIASVRAPHSERFGTSGEWPNSVIAPPAGGFEARPNPEIGSRRSRRPGGRLQLGWNALPSSFAQARCQIEARKARKGTFPLPFAASFWYDSGIVTSWSPSHRGPLVYHFTFITSRESHGWFPAPGLEAPA